MVELTQTDYINTVFIVLVIFLLLFVGFKLIAKYFKLKDKLLLYLGLSLVTQIFTWLASFINFIFILQTGNMMPYEMNLLITNGFPVPLIFWMLVWTNLMYKEKKKLLFTVFMIYWLVMEVIFFYLFFTDPTSMVVYNGYMQTEIGPFPILRNLGNMVISIITVALFYRESHKSDNPEVRLRGTLFLAGVILVFIGVILLTITGLAIFPLLAFIPAVLSYYYGLNMPNWIKERLHRKEE